MPLAPGTRLGNYEIVSAIGAGGMGEVYKARDIRLNRVVAIKVLPGALDVSPELTRRFEREAQAIAALNHPNICIVHDVADEGSSPYFVMEYQVKRLPRDSREVRFRCSRPCSMRSGSRMRWTRRMRRGWCIAMSSRRTLC